MAETKKEAKKGPAAYTVTKLYEKKGETLVRKNKSCPKCGPGYFMAAHKTRAVCGSCGYAEFSTTKEEKK